MAFALSACSSDDPVTPAVTPPVNEGYVPLAVGDSWTFQATQTRTTEFQNRPSPPPEVSVLTGDYSIVTTEELSGATYSVQKRAFLSGGVVTVTTWIRYRQDADGLYVAPVPFNQPPTLRTTYFIEEFAPPVEGERIELLYPLETDATWIINAQQRATVEGPETLQLPAGAVSTWRVRIDNAASGPNDYARAWYAGCGLVRTENHQEIMAMDPGTGDIVKITQHVVSELTEFIPVGDHRCD